MLVPLNFRLAPQELEFAINDSGPRIVLFGETFRDTITGLEKGLVGPEYYICLPSAGEALEGFAEDSRHLLFKRLYEAGEDEPTIEVGLEDDLFIMYTSGTTGRPKGAQWTHSNSMWFSVSQIITLGFQSDDITLLSGPMYHVGSLQDMSMPTYHMGGTCLLLPSLGFKPETVLQTMVKERVTKALLFPVMIFDTLREAKAEFEKTFIKNKLRQYGWNISQTAEAIGIERSNLHKKIKAYDLEDLKS